MSSSLPRRTPDARRIGLMRRRTGFSLLEVLMATGILVGSLVVLMKLASIGRRHAEDAQRLTQAQALCETAVNEIRAGLRPAEPVQDQPLPDAPGWLYSVAVQTLPKTGLVEVQVSVKADVAGRTGPQFTLVHWVSDPETRRQESSASQLWPTPPGGLTP